MASARDVFRGLGQGVIVFAVTAVAGGAAYWLFVDQPDSLTELLGIVLTVGVALGGLQLGSRIASTVLAGYNVGQVAVEGPITRSRQGSIPAGVTPGASDVVDQIERADADRRVQALIVKLNTPGGEIVPSEDIRLAAERFDGPTIAYATDTCASGGYWIASGCDELWAREGSIVGSIGVNASRPIANKLAEKIGIDYEQITAGEYKDAGIPLKEMTDDEREYFQGITDEYYEQFVDRVAEGRGLDPEAARDTEARVFVGETAHEMGLVDELGTREDIEETLAEKLGVDSVEVREFQPSVGLAERLRGGATRVAHAFGAGVGSALTGDGDSEYDFRL